MNLIEAIILALVQGFTEFIPVSSSGHLVLTSKLLGVHSFTYDVLLNIGTLTALIIYFRERILDIINRILGKKDYLLLAKLISATVPTLVLGYFFESVISELNSNLTVVIIMLIIIGIIMIKLDTSDQAKDTSKLHKLTWKQVIIVGLAQALALIPGTSRSGITIIAGLKSNISRKTSAEFSFILAIPTITGAIAHTLISGNAATFLKNNLDLIIIGNIISLMAGLVAIKYLINALNKYGLKMFGYYRIALAVLLIFLLALDVV